MQRVKNSGGFTLLETVLVMGLLTIVGLGMMEMMSNSMKAQKTVDLKSQSQSLETIAKLSLSSSTKCALAFANPQPTPSATFTQLPVFQGLPAPIPTLSPVSIPVAALTLGTKTYSANSNYGNDLTIQAINLVFQPPSTSSPHDYIANLNIALVKQTASSRNLGVQNFTLNIPLGVSTVPDAAIPGASDMTGCFLNASNDDPKVLCKNLGGRWLDSKFFEAQKRCSFSNDTRLAPNECPDSFPGGVAMNLTNLPGEGNPNPSVGACQPNADSPAGEKVNFCYYTSKSATTTYTCKHTVGAGFKCLFDPSIARWVVRYVYANGTLASVYAPGGTVAPSSPNQHICDQGVDVSNLGVAATTIEWQDWMSQAFPNITSAAEPTFSVTAAPASTIPSSIPAPLSYYQWLDTENAVTACHRPLGGDVPANCNNSTDPDNSINEVAGSCVFVIGAPMVSGPSAQLPAVQLSEDVTVCGDGTTIPQASFMTNAFTSTQCMHYYNYTGWMLVKTPRASVASGGKLYISEAKGSPCFEVDVNNQLNTSTGLSDPVTTTPLATLAPDGVTNALVNPAIVQQCVHSAPPYETTAAYGPAATRSLGAPNTRVSVWTCDQSSLGTGPLSPNDILNNGPSGTSMGAKACWWFDRVAISNASGAGGSYPSPNYYTGWGYFLSTAASGAAIKGAAAGYAVVEKGAQSSNASGTTNYSWDNQPPPGGANTCNGPCTPGTTPIPNTPGNDNNSYFVLGRVALPPAGTTYPGAASGAIIDLKPVPAPINIIPCDVGVRVGSP